MIGRSRLRRPVKLFRQGVRLLAIAGLDGECASLDDGEEVQVEGESYRERHQQAQAMAEKSHDVHVADLISEPCWRCCGENTAAENSSGAKVGKRRMMVDNTPGMRVLTTR